MVKEDVILTWSNLLSREWGKPRKLSFTLSDVPNDIRTEDLDYK